MAQDELPTQSKGISNDEYDNQLRDIIKFYFRKIELCVHHTNTIYMSERKTTPLHISNLTKDMVNHSKLTLMISLRPLLTLLSYY